MDDDDKTPRLTAKWDVWASAARELKERMRALQLANRDIGMRDRPGDKRLETAARLAGDLAAVYVRAFEAWRIEDVPLIQKSAEQREFMSLSNLCKELERPKV